MRHTSQRRFAQVQWLAVGPAVVGSPLVTKEDWLLFASGLVVTSYASYGADLDHPRSRATTALPGGKGVHSLIKSVGGGHRMGSHSFLAVGISGLAGYGLALVGSTVAAGLGYAPPPSTAWVLAAAVALGWWGGIFPDVLTRDGAGLLYPLSRRKFHLIGLKTSPPKWAPGPDGKRPKRPNPMLFGEAMFNGLLVLTGIYFAATILAAA